jgi:hypothetical protein
MLGATLRVNFIITDLCRSNIGVSNLVLDTNDRFIDAMFIEDNVIGVRTPSGVQCAPSNYCNSFSLESLSSTYKTLHPWRGAGSQSPPLL